MQDLANGNGADVATDGDDFEAVYRTLEEIVGRLEDGGLSLEESITLYETGMHLAHRCKAILNAAELRVTELQQEFAEDTEDSEDDCADEEPS